MPESDLAVLSASDFFEDDVLVDHFAAGIVPGELEVGGFAAAHERSECERERERGVELESSGSARARVERECGSESEWECGAEWESSGIGEGVRSGVKYELHCESSKG